jgi:hypothetical protein
MTVGAGPCACPDKNVESYDQDNKDTVSVANSKQGNHRGLPLRITDIKMVSWHHFHPAAVKGAGFSLVCQALAGELIDAFALVHKLRPV